MESGFSIVESGFLKRGSEHESEFFPSPGFLLGSESESGPGFEVCLKKQANDRMTVNREVSPGGRKSSKTSRRRGWGCNACKERRIGPSCQHCFAYGEFGHIASECAKNSKHLGNEDRQPRRRDRV